jgi:hypothetical protein
MRKSLILVLVAIGGGATYAAGLTEVATGMTRPLGAGRSMQF